MTAQLAEGWDTILPYIRPLAEFVHDPEVSEIMVNADGRVFVERFGCIQPQPGRFPHEHLEAAVTRIARNLGQDISAARPLLQARLPDGSRVAAAMPPCSVGGITLAIRKFQHARFSLDALKCAGMVTPEQCEILSDAIAERRNILISGGAGAGKTTLLNALCGLVDQRQRDRNHRRCCRTAGRAAQRGALRDHCAKCRECPPSPSWTCCGWPFVTGLIGSFSGKYVAPKPIT